MTFQTAAPSIGPVSFHYCSRSTLPIQFHQTEIPVQWTGISVCVRAYKRILFEKRTHKRTAGQAHIVNIEFSLHLQSLSVFHAFCSKIELHRKKYRVSSLVFLCVPTNRHRTPSCIAFHIGRSSKSEIRRKRLRIFQT